MNERVVIRRGADDVKSKGKIKGIGDPGRSFIDPLDRSLMLKTPIIINGWLIEATLKFLRIESPSLCAYLSPTMARPPVKSSFHDGRDAMLASYELMLGYGEAFAIYSTLELARQKFGNNRVFSGMHLHTMTELWRDFMEKLHLASAQGQTGTSRVQSQVP